MSIFANTLFSLPKRESSSQPTPAPTQVAAAKSSPSSPTSTTTSHSPRKHRGEHRLFYGSEKKQCWNNSSYMIGRDPARWRLDAYGIPVCNALRGCMGLFCHEYDHIIPYSKGGKTDIENCQILTTKLNRLKSNKVDMSFSE